MDSETWQKENLKAIHKRIQWLLHKPDGIILVEPSNAQFLIIAKADTHIRFMLVNQAKPRSNLTQSFMDLQDPLCLFSPYTQATMLGLLWPKKIQHVYVAGLGGGRVPLAIHHYFPDSIIDCAEINPAVVQIAYRYFALPNDNRMRIIVQDGRTGLAQQTPTIKYDLIMVDAFLDNGYTPYSMSTVEFFELCQDRLSSDGVIAINLIETEPYYQAKINTIHQVFPNLYTCNAAGDNQIVFASRGNWIPVDELLLQAAELQQKYQFNFPLLDHAIAIKEIGDLLQQHPELANAQILRDRNPPEDYFDLLPPMDCVFSKIEPETPCPCGSGLTFGQCHGAL